MIDDDYTELQYVRDLNRFEWATWLETYNETQREFNRIEADRNRRLVFDIEGKYCGAVWPRRRSVFLRTPDQLVIFDIRGRWDFWRKGFERALLTADDVSRIRLYAVAELAA